jgi:hypothetical protein
MKKIILLLIIVLFLTGCKIHTTYIPGEYRYASTGKIADK